MENDLKTYVVKSQKVWGITALVVFILGFIVILTVTTEQWERYDNIFYMLLGLSIASWGIFRTINRKIK